MLRVLQFSDFINRHDFIDTIVQNADPREFQIDVCVRTPRCNIAPPVYRSAMRRWVLNGTHRVTVPAAVLQLSSILRESQIDVVHAHHFECNAIAWMATRLSPRTRLVVGRHYSDAIHRLRSAPKRKALLAIEQATNRAAARIVVPSSQIHDILTRRQGVDPAKVDIVPYGFVRERYRVPAIDEVSRIRRDLDLDHCFALANFGRLHEEKGQRHLLEAMRTIAAHHPEVRLLILGEGPERRALERQIRTCGLEKAVRLLGWRRDAIQVMAASDAVVQPSLQEGFSQVMCDALWMAKPLVMTDVSGATDIICDGENGLLVPKEDSAALARAIRRLAHDRNLCSRLGRNGREYVETRLAVERVVPCYEAVYRSAAQLPPSVCPQIA